MNGRPTFLARLGSGPYVHRKLEAKTEPQGVWRLLPFEPRLIRAFQDWTDADIIKLLTERIRNFSSPRDFQRGLLFAMGDLAQTIDPADRALRHNAIMPGYINRLLEAGLAESAYDIGVRRVVIGTSYDANASQTQLGRERLRYGFSSQFSESGDRNVFVTFVERDQGNLAQQTVVADGGNSLTQLKLDGGSTLFSEGDRIRVQQPQGFSHTVVDTVDTGTHILTLTMPLRQTAAAGNIVEQPWSELGLVCGNLAGDSPNTGLLLNRIDRQDFDKRDKMVAIEGQTIYSRASQ